MVNLTCFRFRGCCLLRRHTSQWKVCLRRLKVLIQLQIFTQKRIKASNSWYACKENSEERSQDFRLSGQNTGILSLQILSYCGTHHSQSKRVYCPPYYIAMACNIPRILKNTIVAKCTTPILVFGTVISAIQKYYIIVNLLGEIPDSWKLSYNMAQLTVPGKITDIQYNIVQCIEIHRLNCAYFHN